MMIGAPIGLPLTTISTRRFCCRPAGVSFAAIGRVSPNAATVIAVSGIFCCSRYANTDCARCSDSR